jgi:hypothetical protein
VTKQVKSRVPDVWSTVSWLTLHRIDGDRRYKIDMAEQSQHSRFAQDSASTPNRNDTVSKSAHGLGQ